MASARRLMSRAGIDRVLDSRITFFGVEKPQRSR
jgi:hypothetical protein